MPKRTRWIFHAIFTCYVWQLWDEYVFVLLRYRTKTDELASNRETQVSAQLLMCIWILRKSRTFLKICQTCQTKNTVLKGPESKFMLALFTTVKIYIGKNVRILNWFSIRFLEKPFPTNILFFHSHFNWNIYRGIIMVPQNLWMLWRKICVQNRRLVTTGNIQKFKVNILTWNTNMS